jgi:hypothetical protein
MTSKNACCRVSVMGPRAPRPTLILSTDRIGVISAAVPVKNSSSARYSSSRGTRCSTTGMPLRRARVITVSRVIPGSTDDTSGGVTRVPFFTMNRFSPLPSDR